MTPATALATWFAALALAAWGLPALVTRGLVRAVERAGRTVPNYRGREVVPALGVAWLAWCLGMALFAAAWAALGGLGGDDAVLDALSPATFPLEAAPLFLVLGAFALGLLDDAYGGADEKGLRGHLAALREGRVTTGALKLFGVGALAVVQCSGMAYDGAVTWQGVAGVWIAAVAVTAGSANLVNLADLRPGRALKVYALLSCVSIGAVALDLGGVWTLAQRATAKGAFAVVLLGPLFAAWGFDLRERGMLGDAGANAAGALAGFMMALTLPPAGLYAAAAAVVVLNLLAERYSLSAAIEKRAWLRWLDGLGRPAEAPGGPKEGE